MYASLVLLLIVPGAEANEAEQLFRQMEAKVMKAKNVGCTFETNTDVGVPVQNSMKGTLLIADGNKFWSEAKIVVPDKMDTVTMVSDGSKMVMRSGAFSVKPEDVPKRFGEAVRASFIRCGLLAPMLIMGKIGDNEFKADDVWQVADFKLGKKAMVGQDEAQLIEYTLTIKKPQELTVMMTVWIDTKTQLPLKRVARGTTAELKITVTETYSKWSLDEKIDPKQFELPKE